MSLPNELLPVGLLGTGAAGGYNISRSVRFNSVDSAYLSRTAGTPTASGTWTFSVWLKRSKLGSDTAIFSGRSGGSATQVYFKADNTLRWYEDTADFSTTAVFRDVSSWYHFVFTKNGSSSCTIYVNGIQLQQNTTSVPSTSRFNTSSAELFIGAVGLLPSGISFYGDHYLADIHFIDGQALTPSDFGEFDTNNVWQPKAYAGAYGTNGFHLPFSDNSTAAALGTDTSGNSNTWTVNNISVTAGADNDSLVDSPTNYGTDTGIGAEVRGNYCTLNPLDLTVFAGSLTIRDGNLECLGNNASAGVRGTFFVSSGKWYWEGVIRSGNTDCSLGIGQATSQYYPGYSTTSYAYLPNGNKQSGSATSYGDTYTINDVIGVALDLDSGTITFYKNGVSQGVAYSGISGTFAPFFGETGGSTSTAWVANFGQRPFGSTAPSGYKALCSTNLPTPTIADGSTAMDVVLYTGNNSTQSITGLAFSPDLVWVKGRNDGTYYHRLTSTGLTQPNYLAPNATDAEGSLNNTISSLDANGFTVDGTGTGGTNESGINYVGWAWDAGTSTVTNNDGSITSQVRANPSAGFSIVSYTGDGAASATIGHGLNVAPQMIMVKNRDVADEGAVYHVGVDATAPEDYFLKLFSTSNGTAARDNTGAMWNDTAPTSSVFSVGTEDNVNASTEDYIAYCFAPVTSYSAFGSYTGNGSADGPFVFTGFRPKWVMIKESSAAGNNWNIWDSVRDEYNATSKQLKASSTDAEVTNTFADFTSNGFKIRVSTSGINTSSNTYIYAAFAENPFSLARAR